MKSQKFESSYFHGKSHFEDDDMQDYLVFHPAYRYFKKIAKINHVLALKFKGFSDESIKPLAAFNNSLAPALNYISTKPRV